MKYLLSFLLIMPGLTFAGSPSTQIDETTSSILEVLQSDIDYSLKSDSIETIVKSSFHLKLMSKRILARNWRKASLEQRREFTDLFSDLLIQSYLNKIKTYSTGSEIKIKSEKVKERPNKKSLAVVKTFIITSIGKEILVNYKLVEVENQWLVYDVVIENVSMVLNYRSTYKAIIRKDGIDGLLRRMKKKLTENQVE